MIAMQYRVKLPDTFNMDIIRKRVLDNGYKTDGFHGLLFKLYLIQSISDGNQENIYCPLYIWNDEEGMNKFIFEGFYDNIIRSFGEQRIEVGIVYDVKLNYDKLYRSNFLYESYSDIDSSNEIKNFFQEHLHNESYDFIIYNPDKWKYVAYRLGETFENNCYEILHVSLNSNIL